MAQYKRLSRKDAQAHRAKKWPKLDALIKETLAKEGEGKPAETKRKRSKKTPKAKSVTSLAEDMLAVQLEHALPEFPFVREFLFHPTRKWRFDFCFEEQRLCVEVQGGGQEGKHMRYKGYENDCEKMQAAVELGWTVLYFLPDQIKKGSALSTITKALKILLPIRRDPGHIEGAEIEEGK